MRLRTPKLLLTALLLAGLGAGLSGSAHAQACSETSLVAAMTHHIFWFRDAGKPGECPRYCDASGKIDAKDPAKVLSGAWARLLQENAEDARRAGIDVAAACRARYGAGARAAVRDLNDAYSWYCYR